MLDEYEKDHRIVLEGNTLFASLVEMLTTYPRLCLALKRILFQGETMGYEEDYPPHAQLLMLGFARVDGDMLVIDNRIFEMRLYRYVTSKSEYADEMREAALEHKPLFTKDRILNVPLVMEHFIQAQRQIRDMDHEAVRRKLIDDGTEIFLTYLSLILNGTGTYSVEDRTAQKGRMDVVIHYNGQRYNEGGEKQVCRYLDSYNLKVGYMPSFNFRREASPVGNKTKKSIVDQVRIGDKLVYEGIV